MELLSTPKFYITSTIREPDVDQCEGWDWSISDSSDIMFGSMADMRSRKSASTSSLFLFLVYSPATNEKASSHLYVVAKRRRCLTAISLNVLKSDRA